MSVRETRLEAAAGAARYWWVFVVTGVAWILFSLLILQLNIESVRAIGLAVGFILLFAGIEEFAAGVLVPGWRWLRFLLGLLMVIGGIAALSWPEVTTVTLARILGWYLLFKGTFDVVYSLADRVAEYWWLSLILGFVEIGLAFWVVGYPGRSVTLLLLWVGFSSLTRGMLQMLLGFHIRSARNLIERQTVDDARVSA